MQRLEDFAIDRSKKDGRKSHCRACRKEDMANYYADPTNRPRFLEKARVRREGMNAVAKAEEADNDFVAGVIGNQPTTWDIESILNDNE